MSKSQESRRIMFAGYYVDEWHRCAYRLVHCIKQGIPISSLPKPEYATRFLIPKGIEFESQVLGEIGPWQPTTKPLKELVKEGAIIKKPTLKASYKVEGITFDLIGQPEFIMPHKGEYIAGEVKSHKDVQKTDESRLAFYAFLLKKMGISKQPASKGLLLLKEEQYLLDLSNSIFGVTLILQECARALKDDAYSIRVSKCYECDICRAGGFGDLIKIYDIGRARVDLFRKQGIISTDDLLVVDEHTIKIDGMTTDMISRLKLRAKAFKENKIFQVGDPIQLPEGNIVFLDIETDLGITDVWQIDCMYEGKHHNFLGKNYSKKEQKRIITGFVTFLKTLENPILIMHSGSYFDFRVLCDAMKRLKLNDECEYFSKLKYYDTCILLAQRYVVPGQTYALKELGESFGYPFKTDCKNGIMATLEYEACLQKRKPIPKKLVAYCQDDVECMNWLLEYFSNNTFEKHLLKLSPSRMV